MTIEQRLDPPDVPEEDWDNFFESLICSFDGLSLTEAMRAICIGIAAVKAEKQLVDLTIQRHICDSRSDDALYISYLEDTKKHILENNT